MGTPDLKWNSQGNKGGVAVLAVLNELVSRTDSLMNREIRQNMHQRPIIRHDNANISVL